MIFNHRLLNVNNRFAHPTVCLRHGPLHRCFRIRTMPPERPITSKNNSAPAHESVEVCTAQRRVWIPELYVLDWRTREPA